MTPESIRTARWFRAKGRPIAAVVEVDRAPVGDASLVVIEVRYDDAGVADRYLLVERGGAEPADGDGTWRELVRAIAVGADVRGSRGAFHAAPTAVLAELLPSPETAVDVLDERRLGVEQSNTSVVLGDRLILKLYRLLEPGENPDLEVSAFLTGVGFTDTPPVAGSIVYDDPDRGRCAAAMLQAFVPSRGDAWTAMLVAIERDPDAAVDLSARVGDLARRLHAALASAADDPAFPARAATPDEAASWRADAERELAAATAALDAADRDRFVTVAPVIRARFADAFGRAVGNESVTRIHGDLHLGQLLARTDGGFSVIDFEGEPARPLAERRGPSSPLRDVGGMLRSLDYAARMVERRMPPAAYDADAWLARARAAFLDAYGAVGPLVDAWELAKAVYEVRYEANNRPDWLWLPLAAVERLAA